MPVKMRAIDFHVHLPTPDWLTGAWRDTSRRRRPTSAHRCSGCPSRTWPRCTAQLETMAVLLAWDAETATGRPRVPNETVAAACRDHPDVFTGLGAVDPHKGEAAVAEVANIAALGLRGVKFHPSLQAFAPDDESHWPVFAACERHGLLALFHTGTSGIGARQPGGQGIALDYARPIRLDAVAAAHPGLTVVAAHFGWPWHMELVAMALHKTNMYIDISGWAPRRIPPELVSELRGRLVSQFVWGSDFPFLAPQRCLAELDGPGLPGRGARARCSTRTRPASCACLIRPAHQARSCRPRPPASASLVSSRATPPQTAAGLARSASESGRHSGTRTRPGSTRSSPVEEPGDLGVGAEPQLRRHELVQPGREAARRPGCRCR